MQKLSTENIKKALRGEGGFTLVELLVTVTIIGILAAVVTVGVGGGTSNADLKAKQTVYQQYQTAVDTYIATAATNDLALGFGTGTACAADALCTALYGPAGTATVTGAAADTYYTLTSTDAIVTGGFLRLANSATSVTLVFKGASGTTLVGWK